MNDQNQVLDYILSPDDDSETPVHPLGWTEDDVCVNPRVLLDRELPHQVWQGGQQDSTELLNKGAAAHFLHDQLIIARIVQQ